MNNSNPGRSGGITWLVAASTMLIVVVLGVPGQILTQLSYAVERGRIQANVDELEDVGESVAQLENVSHAFRLVARAVRAGVVRIKAEAPLPDVEDSAWLKSLRDRLEQNLGDRFSDEAWQEYLDSQRLEPSAGSGFVMDGQGHILTNNHVIAEGTSIVVQTFDDRELDATLVGTDPKTDLAVIKVDAAGLQPLKLGDSDKVDVGDWVLAVGAPFGLSQSVTHGIISATGRDDIAVGRNILYQDFIQTDAAINPGNSGGPLVNLRGEVIGINTAIAPTEGGYNAGIAFSIPSNMAKNIARQLIENGHVDRGWLGVSMDELEPEDREIFGVGAHEGVLVNGVTLDAPADIAGVEIEDVVVRVESTPVANMNDLRSAVADITPNQRIALHVIRNGKPLEISVKVGKRPSDQEFGRGEMLSRVAREVEPLGLTVRTLRPLQAMLSGFRASARGALVISAIQGDEAAVSIEPGELIVAVNGKSIERAAALAAALRAAHKAGEQEVELTVLAPGSEATQRTVRFRWDE